MSNLHYHIEPQRLSREGGGYKPCEPHQACRFVVIETKTIPSRLGRRRHHIKRNVEIFTGSAAHLRARHLCDSLTARSGPKPERPRGIWGRSCTIEEYNRITKEQNNG